MLGKIEHWKFQSKGSIKNGLQQNILELPDQPEAKIHRENFLLRANYTLWSPLGLNLKKFIVKMPLNFKAAKSRAKII